MLTLETQGTRFFVSATTTLSTAIEILGVLNWSGLGGTAPVINVSDLQSTAQEKKIGLRDGGELTLGINYNPSTAISPGLEVLEADAGTRAMKKYCIKWSTVDSTGLGKKFFAYCGGVTIDGSEDDVVKGSVQIVLAGGASNTTFAT
jgi:hypothetical protein